MIIIIEKIYSSILFSSFHTDSHSTWLKLCLSQSSFRSNAKFLKVVKQIHGRHVKNKWPVFYTGIHIVHFIGAIYVDCSKSGHFTKAY